MFRVLWGGVVLSAMALMSSQVLAVTGAGAAIPAALYKGSSNSIFPDNFSYFPEYWGTNVDGKTAFLNNDATVFGGAGGVHFAVTDSVLSLKELSDYSTNFYKSYGPLIQLPSVATSVVITYKKSGVSNLNLTSDQLCWLLSGRVQTWGQLLGTSDSTPLRVVYNSNSSGKTEILTRHLNAVCPIEFSVNTIFVKARQSWEPLPWTWVAVNNDSLVASTVNAEDGSIGYSGPDGLDIKNNAVVARINGVLPTLGNVSAALSSIPLPHPPSQPYAWGPIVAKPSVGYSISAYSNLIFGQCYKDQNVAEDVRAFIAKHYSTPGNAVATAAHNFIPLPVTWKNVVTWNFLTNSSGENLDINNPSVCNGIGRP